MSQNHALLLPETVVSQTKKIAKLIRQGSIAPLVGAGFSASTGMATWNDLVRRMVLAWKEWDPDPQIQQLDGPQYFRVVRSTFQTDLAIISYLRAKLDSATYDTPKFGQLLFATLYSSPKSDKLITPSPRHTHRHLMKLFVNRTPRIWTTNYDDLLEEALREMGHAVHTLDPSRRNESIKSTVAHLHGFLPPSSRSSRHPAPEDATVVLAEDDYHETVTDVVGWTNREFYRLFDGHRALILGMSLNDPNLRRVLHVLQVGDGAHTVQPPPPKHFAVVHPVRFTNDDDEGPADSSQIAVAHQARRDYWANHGVELVELPHHESTLPFLMRLRYESYGERPGDLWRKSAQKCQSYRPWHEPHQSFARERLREAICEIQSDFAVADGEIVELGIFLLREDATSLELVFRGGADARAQQGQTIFSADPDSPTGVAGRVFVSSDMVRISKDHELYDYGMDINTSRHSSGTEFEGIISIPIIDWDDDGVPLGVIYITTSTTNGVLFTLPTKPDQENATPTLHDLYQWLHTWALGLLGSME